MENMKDYLTIKDRIELRSLFSNPTQVDSLPNYDKGMSTRKLCIVAILASWVLCIFLLLLGSIPSVYINRIASLVTWTPQLLVFESLLLNLTITLCLEALGFVHSISLRWGLWHEGRLAYNSNLRLLSSTKFRTSVANTALVNLFGAVSLVICYAGASQIFLDAGDIDKDADATLIVVTNQYALIVTGIGIGVQALIATMVICAPKHILTWSSNPLNTTLACMSTGKLERRPGRSLFAAGALVSAEGCAVVQSKQCSLGQTDRSTRHIIRFLWTTTSFALLWAVIVLVISQLDLNSGDGDAVQGPTLTLGNVSIDTGLTISGGYQVMLSSCFTIMICVIQAFVTMATHSAEVIINRVRDEDVWRQAYAHDKGTHFSTSSIKTAMTSWQYLALSTLKPLVHWMFSLSIRLTNYDGLVVIELGYLPEFLLFVLGVALACLIMGIARSSPKGVQPASWGHLQTLADLVDDWGTADDKTLFWGDKGVHEDGVRFAGTSAVVGEVGKIRETAVYR